MAVGHRLFFKLDAVGQIKIPKALPTYYPCPKSGSLAYAHNGKSCRGVCHPLG